METLIYILIALCSTNLILLFVFKSKPSNQNQELIIKIDSLDRTLQKIESNLKEDFKINREENSSIAKENRSELNNTLKEIKKELNESLLSSIKGFEESFDNDWGSWIKYFEVGVVKR